MQVFNLGYLKHLLLGISWRGKTFKRIDMLIRQRMRPTLSPGLRARTCLLAPACSRLPASACFRLVFRLLPPGFPPASAWFSACFRLMALGAAAQAPSTTRRSSRRLTSATSSPTRHCRRCMSPCASSAASLMATRRWESPQRSRRRSCCRPLPTYSRPTRPLSRSACVRTASRSGRWITRGASPTPS